ncbi:MAG: class II aldolase/adducin family protein [Actinomycetales bacterium]
MDKTDVGELRRRLAAAFRWAARLDLHEAVANHFSVATDASGRWFLMNPVGAHFSRVRASTLALVDSAAETAPPHVDPTAWFLHGQIHRLAPSARVIMHTHMPYATTLACLRDYEFSMLDQNACRFHGRIGYDRSYAGMALDEGEGERVAKMLADGSQVLFLGNHGVVVVGDTIAETFDRLYYLEKACQVQVLALSTGRDLSIVPEDVAALAAEQWAEYPDVADNHFTALLEILDEEEPAYRE